MAQLKRWFWPETICFLLIWLLVMIFYQERGFNDPGSLWHVRVGEIILDQGFPTTDPFTYTFAGHTWIPQQWGGELFMAVMHRLGGLDAMLLAFAIMISILFTWLFSRMHAAGMNPVLAGMLTGACLFPGAFHFFIRPHMITILGMAWVMACILDYEQRRASVWRLVGLIPICIAWTNIHGGVLGGVMTLGLAVAYWDVRFLLCRWRQHPTQELPIDSWRKAILINAIVITCLLTPFVNPLGMEMIRTWQRIVGSSVMKQVVNEHMPLNLAHTPDQLIFAFALFYIVFLLGVLLKNSCEMRVSWLLPLVWFVLTFKGIRQGPLFVIVAGVCLADLWPHTQWRDLLKKYGDSLVTEPLEHPLSCRWCLPAAVFMLVVLGLQQSQIRIPVLGQGWARFEPKLVPVDITDSLRRELAALGPQEQFFNDANLGGYMIYHFPQRKIFMDDRFELYGDDWVWNYAVMVNEQPERFEALVEEYQLSLVLLRVDPRDPSRLAQYLAARPEQWQNVASGAGAKLYKRQNSPS